MSESSNPLGPFLVNDFGDRYLYQVNRNVFNAIGSDSLYNSLYGKRLFAEYQLNLIVGTDSGIFPRYIAKNGVPPGSRYLFIELPEVLEMLRQDGQLEDLPPEICFTSFDSWKKRAAACKLQEYIFLDSVYSRVSLAASDAFLPEYRELSWSLNLELNSTIHVTQTSINSSLFTLRELENLTENRLGFAQSLAGSFAGRTAIILAGGPSLQDALPWVRQNRDRVLVIAVSRISRILLAEGIVPHMIITVDPQQISFEVSREMLNFDASGETPLLVNSHHASPLLVGQWPGRSVFTASLFPWSTPLNRDTLSYTGPTVGNYALSIAMNLGCTEIVLAGVDLCFSPKGQTHAAGSNENKVGPDLGQVSPQLETYGGGRAETNQGYAEALQILDLQARIACNHGIRVFNCSQSAAKIDLIDFISLDDLSLQAGGDTPTEIITRCVPESTRLSRLAHYHLVKKELLRARRKLEEILKLAREALGCSDGLFGSNGRKRDFRYKIRMDKIERRLDGALGDFTLLVKKFALKNFLCILKTPQQEAEWTDEQIEKATRDYYEAYQKTTEYLIVHLNNSLGKVNSRIGEEAEHPCFGELISQWEGDKQYGRLRVWRQNHPGVIAVLSAEEQERALLLEQAFERTMTVERTSQMVMLENGHDVKHCRSKALLFFGRKELKGLESMAQGLADYPNQEKALPYQHFVNGLIAELRGETDAATACYQLLLEEFHPLTEDALRQIAALAISRRDIGDALVALECLAGLSTAYLPPYAELLKAVGRFEEAFNCLNRYLGLVPDDVSAMMKLGLLCREAGLNHAAGELFQRVLARDAHNSAAQELLAKLGAPAPA